MTATLTPAAPPTASPVAEADRVPAGQKAAFACGTGVDLFGTAAVSERLMLPFFNIGMGVSPAALGLMLSGFRLVEAILGPIFGNLSDNTRTRWGRRRPWMAVGGLLTGALLPLLFFPPAGLSQTGVIVYACVVGCLLFAANALWAMPFNALNLELTPSYDERTRLGAWVAMISKLFMIAQMWILPLTTSRLFLDASGRPDAMLGTRSYALFAAPLIILLALVPAILVRERYFEANVAKSGKESLWISIRESAACGPLWPLNIASVFLILGFSAVGGVGYYVNVYFVNGGDLAAANMIEGLKGTISFGVGLAVVPFVARLSERFDKRSVAMGLIATAAAGSLLNLVCLTPEQPYLQILPAIFSTGVASAIWVLIPSMKADVADHDELSTGRRREGSLNAFYSTFIKLSLLLSASLGGAVLVMTGFDVKAGAAQPAAVLDAMRLTYSLVPAAFWTVCVLSLWFYPLNRTRMADVRTALEMRRGAV